MEEGNGLLPKELVDSGDRPVPTVPGQLRLQSFKDPKDPDDDSSGSWERSYSSYGTYSYTVSENMAKVASQKGCCRGSRTGITVEPITLLYFIAAGLIKHSIESYCDITGVPAFQTSVNTSQGGMPPNQSNSGMLYTAHTLALYLPGIVLAFFVGAVSDKYGRRVVLFFPSVGILVRAGVTLVVVWSRASPWWLLAASFFDGFSGGPCIMIAGLYGYLSHITTSERRSVRFYLLEVVVVVSAVFVQICGSMQPLRSAGQLYVMIGIMVALVVNLALVAGYLKEPTRMHPERRILDCANLTVTVRVFQKHATKGSVWKLRILVLVVLLLATSVDIPSGIYAKGRTLHADTPMSLENYGWVLALLWRLVPMVFLWLSHTSVSDYVYILAGLGSALAVNCWRLVFLDNNFTQVTVYASLGFMMSVPVPLVRSTLSKVARQRDQGAVAAGVSIAQQVGLTLAGFICTFDTINLGPMLGIGFIAVSIVLTGYTYWRARRDYIQRENNSGLLAGMREYTPIL